MTDTQKRRSPDATDFISGRSDPGDRRPLRRWSVATLLAQSRTTAEDLVPESVRGSRNSWVGEK